MRTASITLATFAALCLASGCARGPAPGAAAQPLPFVINAGEILVATSDRESAVEAAGLLQLATVEPVQHDELDCTKGPSHLRVKKTGSLQDEFDSMVSAGWDCVLILD
jgi:hypothetical protein